MWWMAARVAAAAPETCNGVDDDGDGLSDEAPVAWYDDADLDTFGNPAAIRFTGDCLGAPANTVAVGGDCDDQDPDAAPGLAEGDTPNGRDDDCNGLVDDLESPPASLRVERDEDSTFVVDTRERSWNNATGDCDGRGYHLVVVEDEAENTLLSELLTSDPVSTWWLGLSESASGFEWVDGSPTGFDAWATDQPAVDGDLGDCGLMNEGTGEWFVAPCSNPHPFVCELDCVPRDTFLDWDGDGTGDPTTAEPSCALDADRVYNGADCDDDDPAVTVRVWYHDADDDGVGGPDIAGIGCEAAESAVTGDCDDTDPRAFPGAEERCNGRDNDCDGQIDQDVPNVSWFRDRDGDGYGETDSEQVDCVEPGADWVREGGDCDDEDPETFPGAPDPSDDGLDQDCSGASDAVRDPPGGSEEDVGCGCGSSPVGVGWLVLLPLVVLRRRP